MKEVSLWTDIKPDKQVKYHLKVGGEIVHTFNSSVEVLELIRQANSALRFVTGDEVVNR